MHRRQWLLAACVVASAGFAGPLAADNLATCRAGKGSSDAVVAACSAAIADGHLKDQALAEAHLNRGLAQPNNKAAIADYNEAIKLSPDLVAAYVDRGVAYHNMGQHEHAVRDFLKALELKPGLAIAWGDLGVTYSSMRDWNHAIEALGKAIALNPADPVNLNNRCYAYNMTRAYDDAIQDCSKAIELNPNYTLSFVGRGNGYWNKGDYDQAIENYNRAIALEPSRVLSWMARGSAYTKKGNYDAAIADYGQAIKLDPARAQAWNGRCWARVVKGQDPAELKLALNDCNRALELQTNEAAIFDSRALVYLKLGKYDESIADYDRALDLDPKMATSLFGRGIARNRKDAGAGKQDLADAKRQTLTIADEMARYGVAWTDAAANAPANLPAKRREP